MGVIGEAADRFLGFLARTPTVTDILDMARRDRFSEYLPYRDYDPDAMMFRNLDRTIGAAWECTPVYFASDDIGMKLLGMFNQGYPEGTIMQFILHADPHIKPIIKEFVEKSCNTTNPFIKSTTKAYEEFLLNGTKGIKDLSGLPLRDFRLFVTLKYPDPNGKGLTEEMRQQIQVVENVLSGVHMAPRRMDADNMLEWLFRLFNDNVHLDSIEYDEGKGFHEQVIKSETAIKPEKHRLKIGEKIFKCLSIKKAPRKINLLQARQLIGGIYGLSSDGAQITSPFIYAVNVIFENVKGEVGKKAWATLRQKPKSDSNDARTIARRQEELQIAADRVESERFVRVMPLFWVYDTNEVKLDRAVTTAEKVVWGQQGYEMQRDWGILQVLFLSSLPFGLYNIKNNVLMIDRDFIQPSDTAIRMLPFQSGYRGGSSSLALFIDRNGQVCNFDHWDPSASNYNGLITAAPGKGKSFLLNYLNGRYLGNDTQMFIVDIGKSYEKQCKRNKGRFLRFSKDSNVCINPFYALDKEDLQGELAATASNIMNMAYSSAMPELSQTEITTMERAVAWAYQNEGDNAKIDHVQEYLMKFPFYASDLKDLESKRSLDRIAEGAHLLGYNLNNWNSKGIYGRWVNGKNSFDISQDQFAVLELEELKAIPPLFTVITRQVLDYVTKAIYLGGRDRKKRIEVDEAHLFLKDNHYMGALLEQVYRRVRKHEGGIDIITHSPLDLATFPGGVGQVIWNCSDFKFLLESSDYERAKAAGILTYDPFVMKLLTSVKTFPGKYSEIFIDGPFGVGVVRLAVPKYVYYENTTKGPEVEAIYKLVDSFSASRPEASPEEHLDMALWEMVRRSEGRSDAVLQ